MNSRPVPPPIVRQFEMRQRAQRRRHVIRRLRRSLSSSETWVVILIVAIAVGLLLWLLAHAIDALTDPVQAAMDLVRLGPKSRR